MASKIQIKRGTGTSVPSGLSDGELAINLDNRKLYYGSSSTSVNELHLANLTADKATITSLTSSIVSSSIIYSSGSNIFGDESTDTHLFNGDITGSGNISASGTITANSFVGGLTGDATGLTGTPTITVGDINVSGKITHEGDTDTKITLGNDDINITVGNVNMLDFTENASSQDEITFNEEGADLDIRMEGSGDQQLFVLNAGTDEIGIGTNTPTSKLQVAGDLTATNITSSANISGSLTGTVSAGSGSYHILQGDTSKNTGLYVDGTITASSDISSSGDLKTGANIHAPNIGAGVDNSVVVLDSDGTFKTDEIDSRVWGSSLVDKTGTPVNNQLAIFTDSDTIEGDADITYDGTTFKAISDISASGVATFGTEGAGQTHLFYGRIRTIGSGVTIGDGHISMSGNLVMTGSISGSSESTASFAHIITSGDTIEFKDGATKLGDLKFDSSNGLEVQDASKNPTKLRAGSVTTPILRGTATGDQSGSLYLSGSLTFRDNEAIPAVSASTLYDQNGHLYYGGGLIGGYFLSASAAGNAPTVGYVKILPQNFVVADGSSSTTLYYNQGFEDDGSEFGIRNNTANLDIYAFKDIPFGWTAVGFRTYGSSNDTVTFHVYDMTDGSRTADGNTGTLNGAEVTLATPVTSDPDKYFGIHINPNSSGDVVFGGYIKIERR